MEDAIKLIATFISGGLAGNFLNIYNTNKKNKIQYLECHYLEDDIISKLPVEYEQCMHNNLHSKKFKIINTTNKDINEVKVQFSFENQCLVAKCKSYSKAGVDKPKGFVTKNKNECYYKLKNFNRGEEIEIEIEIGNVLKNEFNVTELDILGVKLKYLDKRKQKSNNSVKMVQKKQL